MYKSAGAIMCNIIVYIKKQGLKQSLSDYGLKEKLVVNKCAYNCSSEEEIHFINELKNEIVIGFFFRVVNHTIFHITVITDERLRKENATVILYLETDIRTDFVAVITKVN